MICAGGIGVDTCQGDDGGQMVCWFDGKWYQEGVTSWYGCAAKIFGAYAHVRNMKSRVEKMNNREKVGLVTQLWKKTLNKCRIERINNKHNKSIIIVLLVATIAKVPNISHFIQSSSLPESIRNLLTD